MSLKAFADPFLLRSRKWGGMGCREHVKGRCGGVGLGMGNFGSWGFRAGDIGELVGSVTCPSHLLSTSISRPLYCPLPLPSFSGTES